MGYSFSAPGGLPPVSVLDNRFYKTPHCATVILNLDENEPIKHNRMTWDGVLVSDVKSCEWGGDSLHIVKENKGMIAFCTGRIGDNYFAFYMKLGCRINAVTIDNNVNMGFSTTNIKEKIYWVTKKDMSPIKEQQLFENVGLAFIDGSKIAIANYGNFLHSNNSSGFEIMNQVYRKFGSNRPYVMMNHMKSYPWFSDNNIEFPIHDQTSLIGHKSIMKLKLKFQMYLENEKLDINLNKKIPEKLEVLSRNVEFE